MKQLLAALLTFFALLAAGLNYFIICQGYSTTGMATVLLLGGFLAAGLLRGAWHPAWMLLLFIPLVQSAAGAVRNRNPHEFAFWLLALIAYLVLGFAPLFGIADRGLWHPGWVVFLLIPVYHSFVAYLRRGKRQ